MVFGLENEKFHWEMEKCRTLNLSVYTLQILLHLTTLNSPLSRSSAFLPAYFAQIKSKKVEEEN